MSREPLVGGSDPPSHGPAKGATAHSPDCSCTRCAGFQPGHTLSVGHGRPPDHGAYAVLHLTPRAGEIAAWIRTKADHLTEYDEAEVQRGALVLAQLERAAGVLGEVDEAIERGEDVDVYLGRIERRASLSKDARGWASEARRTLDGLGLTPNGRSQIEAAQQRPEISAVEAHALFAALFNTALEYVDRVRRDEFMRRIDTVTAGVLGELPPAPDAGREGES